MPVDEAALIALAKEGDREAFEQLVRETYTDTYTLAYRLCGNEEDAADVTQETYLRAWKGLKRFRGDAQLSTWLYRITANCASTHLSRRTKHSHDELNDETPVADERRESDPEIRVEDQALRLRLQDALEDLPPKLRSVIVLRDIYDLPHEDIADELGISQTAAKVRLHRARRKLREDLFPRSSEEEAHAV
jgi:RNA polymerase sigma-70 factor (ECF subfamily)